MKQAIHPEYAEVTVQCACGASFITRSTLQRTVQVDVCSSCHPFFTGQQKLMDTAGRIDRLKKKFGNKIALGSQKKAKPAAGSIREKLRSAAQEPKKQEEKQ